MELLLALVLVLVVAAVLRERKVGSVRAQVSDLELELAEAKQQAFLYQKDWKKMLDLVQAMDSLLEKEQELVKSLLKAQEKKGKK